MKKPEKVDLKKKKVLVIDNGLFVEIAIMLSRYFGEVGYHVWNKGAFPRSNASLIGSGIEGVKVVINLWDHIDKYDVIVFPDVYDGDLCAYLRRHGKLVWGSGKGEAIELYRWETKELFRKIGLPVQHVERVVGIDALKDYLKNHHHPTWIKISRYRGDTETFPAPDYESVLPKLNEIQYTMGAKGMIMEFIVEDSIDGDEVIETGYDGYSIDGQFPSIGVAGFEIKDEGYVCAVKPYSEIALEVREVNTKIAPWMKDRQYRNFFSTEIRIPKDGKPYCIDPCARSGSPPNEIYQELFDNWGEIIWQGAQGICIDPHPVAKFGCMVMVHSMWANSNLQHVRVPRGIRQFVKFRNFCQINGENYIVPMGVGLPEIGAVIGIGDTLDQAVEHCLENVQLCEDEKWYQAEFKKEAIEEGIAEAKKGEGRGIKIL